MAKFLPHKQTLQSMQNRTEDGRVGRREVGPAMEFGIPEVGPAIEFGRPEVGRAMEFGTPEVGRAKVQWRFFQ